VVETLVKRLLIREQFANHPVRPGKQVLSLGLDEHGLRIRLGGCDVSTIELEIGQQSPVQSGIKLL